MPSAPSSPKGSGARRARHAGSCSPRGSRGAVVNSRSRGRGPRAWARPEVFHPLRSSEVQESAGSTTHRCGALSWWLPLCCVTSSEKAEKLCCKVISFFNEREQKIIFWGKKEKKKSHMLLAPLPTQRGAHLLPSRWVSVRKNKTICEQPTAFLNVCRKSCVCSEFGSCLVCTTSALVRFINVKGRYALIISDL